MAIRELKRHESPGTDQIQAEFIIAGGRTILSEITKHINSIWYSECLRIGRSRSLYPSLRKVKKQNVVIIQAYRFGLLRTNIYASSFFLS